ncbi:hypothetical protein QFZ32_005573 [Streptomyces canus]|nr:hypothetical protein [Streptomyces canus]
MAVGTVPAESVQQPGREAGLAGEGGRVGESFLLGACLGGEEPEDVGAHGRGVVEQGREAAAWDGPYGAWGECGEGGRVAASVEQRDLVEGARAGPRSEPYDASGGGRDGGGRGAARSARTAIRAGWPGPRGVPERKSAVVERSWFRFGDLPVLPGQQALRSSACLLSTCLLSKRPATAGSPRNRCPGSWNSSSAWTRRLWAWRGPSAVRRRGRGGRVREPCQRTTSKTFFCRPLAYASCSTSFSFWVSLSVALNRRFPAPSRSGKTSRW